MATPNYPREGWKRIWYKIKRAPVFLLDALAYPPRRRNSIWRIVESLLGLVLVWWLQVWWAIPLGVLVEFLVFELAAEPFGWTGYYFERGPRDGESPHNDGYWLE